MSQDMMAFAVGKYVQCPPALDELKPTQILDLEYRKYIAEVWLSVTPPVFIREH